MSCAIVARAILSRAPSLSGRAVRARAAEAPTDGAANAKAAMPQRFRTSRRNIGSNVIVRPPASGAVAHIRTNYSKLHESRQNRSPMCSRKSPGSVSRHIGSAARTGDQRRGEIALLRDRRLQLFAGQRTDQYTGAPDI